MPKAAVLMKTLAVGAQLWHKRTMGTGIGPEAGEPGNPAGGYRGTTGSHRGTAGTPLPKWGRRVEGLEARLSGGGPDAGPHAGRQAQEAGGTGKEAAQKASPRLCPAADGTHAAGGPRPGVLPRMPHHPDRGGWVQRTPGGHRDSGGPGGGHGARLHGPDVSVMPETEAAPGAAAGRCRGPGSGLGSIWSV